MLAAAGAVQGVQRPSPAGSARRGAGPVHAARRGQLRQAFTEWGQVFGDEVLATSILDRLLHHCEEVAISGPSYRPKNRLKAIERDTEVTWPGGSSPCLSCSPGGMKASALSASSTCP
ncbi:hypothetical protein GCM10010277_77460 [Streptomyces longisporoflavus]|nr:hypothetical protein GCM10010277_77460 [Streptomyces longisporoflavus]